jgi:Fe-S-cluster containining protein
MRRLEHDDEPAGNDRSGLPRRIAERAALKALDAVYRKAGELLAGFGCALSGECCQLAATRREPYLFPIEQLRVRRALESAGREVPPARAEGGCALLDASGRRCSIYADRPFGCRTFFCDRVKGPGPMPTAQLLGLTARLTRVSDELDPGARPRPLSELLDEVRATASGKGREGG